MDLAWGRTHFLKKVVDPQLLELEFTGDEDDEDALCKIHWFFMNHDWWEKARNLNLKFVDYYYGEEYEQRVKEEEDDLIGFILSKEHMIHPNVVKMVQIHDN